MTATKRLFPALFVALFLTTALSAGWTEMTPVPATPSGKPVKTGGWLVYNSTDDVVYAAKGYKTGDFYAYTPTSEGWVLLAEIPEGLEAKPPKRGAKAAWDEGGFVYATKGNNTLGFWAYDIANDAWVQQPDVPLGPGNKKVKGGTDLVYVPGDGQDAGFVYLLKGYKDEFYRFDIGGDVWETLPNAPRGKNLKWGKGSWLVYDGDQTLYAHKAKFHELWAFDLETQTWAEAALTGMPRDSYTGKKKKSREGSDGEWYDGIIYALKGGNTCEFWMYAAGSATWSELEAIPEVGSTGGKKRVKHGGDLVGVGDGVFYALKGKKTLEFWRYDPPEANSVPVPHEGVAGVTVLARNVARLALGSAFAGPARVRVFGATGQAVQTQDISIGVDGGVKLDVSALNQGVYLVRFTTATGSATRKLTVH